MNNEEENVLFLKALASEQYQKKYNIENRTLPLSITVHQEYVKSGLDGDYFIDENEEKSPVLTFHEYWKWRKGTLIVSYASITIQLALAIISIVEGLKVDSAGTLGFGIEMAMDIGTTLVVIWHYASSNEIFVSKAKEKIAVVVLSSMMCLFSVGIVVKTIYNLITEKKPFNEFKLMLICSAAAFVFSFVAWIKLYLSAKLGSKSVYLDAMCTFGCLSMAIALMLSLMVYHFTKLWFLDGAIAIFIALVMFIYGARTLYKVYKKPPEKV